MTLDLPALRRLAIRARHTSEASECSGKPHEVLAAIDAEHAFADRLRDCWPALDAALTQAETTLRFMITWHRNTCPKCQAPDQVCSIAEQARAALRALGMDPEPK